MKPLTRHLATPAKAFLICLCLAACQTTGTAEEAFTPTVSSTQQRGLDSRRFDTGDEVQILNAVVAVLQDLGFKLEETERSAGLVSGSKGTGKGKGWFLGRDIRVTVTTRPIARDRTVVRATFQDIRRGHDARFTFAEPVRDPAIYQDFFDKLAQSLFLEAHGI